MIRSTIFCRTGTEIALRWLMDLGTTVAVSGVPTTRNFMVAISGHPLSVDKEMEQLKAFVSRCMMQPAGGQPLTHETDRG